MQTIAHAIYLLMNLSIIVPVYNEQENIARCISALMRVLDGIGLSYEVVCVDDGSRDLTWDSFTRFVVGS